MYIQFFCIGVYVTSKLIFYFQTTKDINYIEFIDVGQGDATLIDVNNTKILIDGGPDYDILFKLQKYMLFTRCSIDVVILTHPHADHIAGLNRVLEFCTVSKVVFPYFESKTSYDTHFLDLVVSKDILIPDLYSVLTVDAAQLYFLWPPKGYLSKNINNQSLVMLFKQGDFDALLMGDAEIEAQKEIPFHKYVSKITGEIDVLKTSHHGSVTGNNEGLFKLYKINSAIISVGAKNMYRLPSQKTLDTLTKYNTSVFRTDKLGSIVIKMDKL